ncbi:Rdx family protein [Chitinophagaceae bacterium LB-8]|uniref:Rdx family protein n=1 Tax=Paraflavisolibacter caeni TaxID=2982496 RepID=A0A9X3BGF1_9BACT|nr:Rdx family protein [Paraflavisolibacter caeni]MCU7550779.1 Rdx family protein [Paraflavisolibacter caeni]
MMSITPGSSSMEGVVIIEYCPKCGWMLRAAYMAQELLTSFTGDIKGVLLRPSQTSGSYTISVNDKIIFDRKTSGRFPEIKELKQMVRDEVAPNKSLGHSDRK